LALLVRIYFIYVLSQVGFIAVTPTDGAVTCPASVEPCICDEYAPGTGGISLRCLSGSLNDAKFSKILDGFSSKNISPLLGLSVVGNEVITKIPSQLASKFPKLHDVTFIRNKNLKTFPPSGAFLFTDAPKVSLTFSENAITSIPQGAFNFPKATDISLDFSYNRNLEAIDADAIKSE
jgi:hypothetical protein